MHQGGHPGFPQQVWREGQVLAVEGAGDDARAQVHFRATAPRLALAVAALTVV